MLNQDMFFIQHILQVPVQCQTKKTLISSSHCSHCYCYPYFNNLSSFRKFFFQFTSINNDKNLQPVIYCLSYLVYMS